MRTIVGYIGRAVSTARVLWTHLVCMWHLAFLEIALKRNKNDLDALLEAKDSFEGMRRVLSSLIPTLQIHYDKRAPMLCCVESLCLVMEGLIHFLNSYRGMPADKKSILQWVSRRHRLVPPDQSTCGEHMTGICYGHHSLPSHEELWRTGFPDLEMLLREQTPGAFLELAETICLDSEEIPYRGILRDYLEARADIETTRSRLAGLIGIVHEQIDILRIIPLRYVAYR